jgi:hypothetical protein
MPTKTFVLNSLIAFAFLLETCDADAFAPNSTTVAKATANNSTTVPRTTAPSLPTGTALGDLLAAALASAYAGAGVAPPQAEQDSRGQRSGQAKGRPQPPNAASPAWQANGALIPYRPRAFVLIIQLIGGIFS